MQDAAKAGKVLVIHAPYKWDDVGTWLALERHNPQDADGNTIQGLHCGVQHEELRDRRRPGPPDRHDRRRATWSSFRTATRP